ncbi:hypothetical protein I6F07_01995 [Ensifer sp. IC4062]|nr:hypothetical protein [Ensifer sp. IC4062]MCA1439009.1 hypothetical protein [Ensifer sp. IC4062]
MKYADLICAVAGGPHAESDRWPERRLDLCEVGAFRDSGMKLAPTGPKHRRAPLFCTELAANEPPLLKKQGN